MAISVLACISCFIVITSSSPVTSVIYLITTFIIIALYLSLNHIVYIGLTYIIVYVGAVIVLFLFVIIIINLDETLINYQSPSINNQFLSKLWHSACQTILFICLCYPMPFNAANQEVKSIMSNWQSHAPSLEETISQYEQIQSIGFTLYSITSIWLIILSIILILAIIGPIVCCKNLILQLVSLKKQINKILLK